MQVKSLVSFLLLLLGPAWGKVYFEEQFNYEEGTPEEFLKKWKYPTEKPKGGDSAPLDLGKWEIYSGRFSADAKINRGLRTSQDAKFYALTSKLEKPFSNKDKTLIVQFSVKHEQVLDCGGGYVKLLSSEIDPKKFDGQTPYYLMFGPDICGPNRRIHCIISYKGTNYLWKKEITPSAETSTHLYKFVLKPDQTYAVYLDDEEVAAGSLLEDWDFLGPKEIPDPKVTKPTDWVDDEEIDDPSEKKPDGWDEIPERIVDPEAKKPEAWDDEMDGEWKAPLILNPDFKGEWKPNKIKNPAYKGAWEHPTIPNPDYKLDTRIYEFPKIGYVGFDLWQVKSGTIFDNIIITDDETAAKKLADETWAKLKEAETKSREAYEQALMKTPHNPKNDEEEDTKKTTPEETTEEEKTEL